MSVSDVPVYLTMRRRDAERARAERGVNTLIRDNLDMERDVDKGKVKFLTDVLLVARVVGVHGDCNIANLGLETLWSRLK